MKTNKNQLIKRIGVLAGRAIPLADGVRTEANVKVIDMTALAQSMTEGALIRRHREDRIKTVLAKKRGGFRLSTHAVARSDDYPTGRKV